MTMLYDRKTATLLDHSEGMEKQLEFYYGTFLGRCLLKIFTQRVFSKAYGWYLSSRYSQKKIKKYIDSNPIDLGDYEKDTYTSFNDFFTRKRKNVCWDTDLNNLIAPADSKMSCYEISKDLVLFIKNSQYTLEELLQCNTIPESFAGGKCLVFRLTLSDYHRYIYIDTGYSKKSKSILGVLHTVRSVALSKVKVFARNSREWTVLHTQNFGRVVQIEVGALEVGKIVNHKKKGDFLRGMEKGYFAYGGSTIILLFEKEAVKIDQDILEYSSQEIETIVHIGEKIGVKDRYIY